MSVLSAGNIIRKHRVAAGLTQEQLSEGVCSSQALSQIETGKLNPSASTFRILMTNAGHPCEAYPSFLDREEYLCCLYLRHARFYIYSWQLDLAHEVLSSLANNKHIHQKYYYQAYLLRHCQLQILSGVYDKEIIYQLVLSAIQLTRPGLTFTSISNSRLLPEEYSLFALLAYLSVFNGRGGDCITICTQLRERLDDSGFNLFDKNDLMGEICLAEAWCYYQQGDYEDALLRAEAGWEHLCVTRTNYLIFELAFLCSLSYLRTGSNKKAVMLLYTCYFSAHAVNSAFSTVCIQYATQHHLFSKEIPKLCRLAPPPALRSYPFPSFNHSHTRYFGIASSSPPKLSIGALLQMLRWESGLSQVAVCHDICSKSELSKIENGQRYPRVDVCEALLQRLGVSEHLFTFFGNEHEAQISQMQSQVFSFVKSTQNNMIPLLDEIETMLGKSDRLQHQFLTYKRSMIAGSLDEKETLLKEALRITSPDVSFDNLSGRCFSWLEFNALIQLADISAKKTFSRGVGKLYGLLDYLRQTPMDLIHRVCLEPVVLNKTIYHLWKHKQYHDIIALSEDILLPHNRGKSSIMYTVYAHLAEAMFETDHNKERAILIAHHAYHMMRLLRSDKSAEDFRSRIQEHYGTIIP